jgi:disulfide bond formation protein DsbB
MLRRFLISDLVILLVAIAAFSSLGIALIMQYVFELLPCPLCIIQRVIVVSIGIFLVFAYLARKYHACQNVMLSIALIFSVLGVAAAGRHVWLQYLPKDQIPGCLPSLTYLIETFSVFEVVNKVMQGSSECAAVKWTFLGLSIPEQTLVMFITFSSFSLFKLFFQQDKDNRHLHIHKEGKYI